MNWSFLTLTTKSSLCKFHSELKRMGLGNLNQETDNLILPNNYLSKVTVFLRRLLFIQINKIVNKKEYLSSISPHKQNS